MVDADVSSGMIRAPTDNERREFMEVGTQTPQRRFLKELAWML